MLILLAASPAGTDDDNFARDLAAFHLHYNRFFREYFGCDRDALAFEDCHQGNGVFDLREFKAAKEAAKRVWELK